MTTAAHAIDQPTFTITEEIFVRASIDDTFDSLITQMGRQNETLDGKPLPMIIETKPGGRWYRDLGGDSGHLWGFLSGVEGGTQISFKHTLLGPVPDEFRQNIGTGWSALHARVKQHAEGGTK